MTINQWLPSLYPATSKFTCLRSNCSSFPPSAANLVIFQCSSSQWKVLHPSSYSSQPRVDLDTFPILSPTSNLPPSFTDIFSLKSLSYLGPPPSTDCHHTSQATTIICLEYYSNNSLLISFPSSTLAPPTHSGRVIFSKWQCEPISPNI